MGRRSKNDGNGLIFLAVFVGGRYGSTKPLDSLGFLVALAVLFFLLSLGEFGRTSSTKDLWLSMRESEKPATKVCGKPVLRTSKGKMTHPIDLS